MTNYLYVAQYSDRCGGTSPSHKKIGITRNVPARMRSLSDTKGTMYIEVLGLWASEKESTLQKYEVELHRLLGSLRLNGEWFADTDQSLLDTVRSELHSDEHVKEIPSHEVPEFLPRPVDNRCGHNDYVDRPKGRTRDTTNIDVIGELQQAYRETCRLLPGKYVQLNDNGPYVRANKNDIAFWLEPRKAGVRLNYWATPGTDRHSTMCDLKACGFDGDAVIRPGKGRHEGQVNFSICPMSLADLATIVERI